MQKKEPLGVQSTATSITTRGGYFSAQNNCIYLYQIPQSRKIEKGLFVCLFVFIYSLSLKLIVYKYTFNAFIIED